MLPTLLFTLFGMVAGFVLALALARHRARSSAHGVRQSTRRAARLTSLDDDRTVVKSDARMLRGLPSREHTQEALLAAFRPDEMPESEDVLREDQRILADALSDIARRRGASAAVLWALDDTMGGVARPIASSADDARSSQTPARMPIVGATDRQLIEWSARERVIAFDATTGAPRLAAAPLDGAGALGALSLHFEEGAAVTREALREWLPPHALAMEALHSLVRTRADVARQNFRLRGLIRTASRMQAFRDPLELESVLVADALPVVGAEWAALVRWDARSGTGIVRAATAEAVALGFGFEALEVKADSIAGQVCAEGRPQAFADARTIVRGVDTIFGSEGRIGMVGSLLAVPLRRGEDDRPTGALVCGHREVAALRAMEARNARNLGVIAAGALETAWMVELARRNARIDPLTELANRRGFDERYEQVIQETDRYGGTAALVLLDVDHFKQVNDSFGHEAGDEVLVAIAKVIADGRRTVDLAARLGGEELAVLLPQTDAGGARELAERLRQRIENLRVRTGGLEIRVTASFGIGEYSARAGDADAVKERADQALYVAKHNGRNRVEVAT